MIEYVQRLYGAAHHDSFISQPAVPFEGTGRSRCSGLARANRLLSLSPNWNPLPLRHSSTMQYTSIMRRAFG